MIEESKGPDEWRIPFCRTLQNYPTAIPLLSNNPHWTHV